MCQGILKILYTNNVTDIAPMVISIEYVFFIVALHGILLFLD